MDASAPESSDRVSVSSALLALGVRKSVTLGHGASGEVLLMTGVALAVPPSGVLLHDGVGRVCYG